ncbi:hypothetical protein GCM10009827_081070 [Dactylosporangium maewongense]|uniref:Uncharacterized protein n=1 Tax=Dactylosporangium maewongense TaxID=634393 RepID=A0ABP4MQ32_9ACTN
MVSSRAWPRTATFAAVAVAALTLLVGVSATPAAAGGTGSAGKSTGKSTGTSTVTGANSNVAAKPLPAAPSHGPNVQLGTGLPVKPAVPQRQSTLAAGWQVSLNVPGMAPTSEGVMTSVFWVTQNAHITATANQDVGPTPYYIRIYRNSTQFAICGTGTTCSVDATSSVIDSAWFSADISDAAGNKIVASNPPFVLVDWHSTTVGLSTSQTTTSIGSAVTLTATTAFDVGPSPFYTQIFDLTTGARVQICGTGTSCSVSIAQSSATTHRYRAFVSHNSATFPLPAVQATSLINWVTWSNSGLRVSLTAPVFTQTTETVTATANSSVTPTPWYIEIFDADTGVRIAFCGNGSVCSLTGYTPPTPNVDTHLIAFISSLSTAFPPANIQASSNVVTTMHYVPR